MKKDYVYDIITNVEISRDVKMNVIHELTEMQFNKGRVTKRDLYNMIKDYLDNEQKAKILNVKNDETDIKNAENDLYNRTFDSCWDKVFCELRNKLYVNGNYREILHNIIRKDIKKTLHENGYNFKIPKKIIKYKKEPVFINNNLVLKEKNNKLKNLICEFPFYPLPDWIVWDSKSVLDIKRKMFQNIILNVLYRAKVNNVKDLDQLYSKLMYKLSKEIGTDLLKKYEDNKEVIVYLLENNNKNGWIDINSLMSQINTL